MIAQALAFQTDGEPISWERYGDGHINETYLIEDNTKRKYILQKINRNVFKQARQVMENVRAVTRFLHTKVHSERESLSLLPTKKGEDWLTDDAGDVWRMYPFIADSICFSKVESLDDFRQSGIAFGNFQKQLADFDADSLYETIPRFHDTPNRYEHFKAAVANDTAHRVKDVQVDIDFILAREDYAKTLMVLQDAGKLPLRVTHNDTKLNNVLFDIQSRRPICVVDLDTVMPGLAVNDFGDAIRFGASTAKEDEADLSKVHFSLASYEAFADGFLTACGDSLTECEILHLRDGAKMMTLEVAVRFLTDYLEGDVYFKTKHAAHNLERARTQIKLVQEMEMHWDEMQSIVLRLSRVDV